MAVNNTVCNGFNSGACRTDCNPEPDATEAECRAKGFCWQEVWTTEPSTKQRVPSKSLPWCFFPGGSQQCMLGQVAKDADPAVKAAAQAYHKDGSEASAEAYRQACLAHGDWFYSFFVTPQFWHVDTYGNGEWRSSKVTLVKYGCNSKACNDADIQHVIHRMSAPQNEMAFSDFGTHASLMFNVTGYSAQKTSYNQDEASGSDSSDVGLYLAVTVLGLLLIAITALAFHWYRKYSIQRNRINAGANVYHKRDSFPVHVHSSLDQTPTSTVSSNAQPATAKQQAAEDSRKSLIDSEV